MNKRTKRKSNRKQSKKRYHKKSLYDMYKAMILNYVKL